MKSTMRTCSAVVGNWPHAKRKQSLEAFVVTNGLPGPSAAENEGCLSTPATLFCSTMHFPTVALASNMNDVASSDLSGRTRRSGGMLGLSCNLRCFLGRRGTPSLSNSEKTKVRLGESK